jgi:hypothetical protein
VNKILDQRRQKPAGNPTALVIPVNDENTPLVEASQGDGADDPLHDFPAQAIREILPRELQLEDWRHAGVYLTQALPGHHAHAAPLHLLEVVRALHGAHEEDDFQCLDVGARGCPWRSCPP